MLTKKQIACIYALALYELAEHIMEHPDEYFGSEDAPIAEGFDLQVSLERGKLGVTPSVQIKRRTYLPGKGKRPIRTVNW